MKKLFLLLENDIFVYGLDIPENGLRRSLAYTQVQRNEKRNPWKSLIHRASYKA